VTREPSSLVSVFRGSILPEKPGAYALRGGFLRRMNARPEIREHLLAEKMKFWLMVARTPYVKPGIPKWRARKNFWALQKRHAELAKRLGLTAASVF